MTFAEITDLLDQFAAAGVFFLTIPPHGAHYARPFDEAQGCPERSRGAVGAHGA